MPGCWPGGTVGAGGAYTGGVNRLPPVGLMLFSVGATGGAAGGEVVVGAVVVVVVEVSGAFSSSLAQDADKPTIVTIAKPPATAEKRRIIVVIPCIFSILMSCYQLISRPLPS